MQDGFRTNLSQLLKARFPILYVETYEEQRLLAEVTAVVTDPTVVRTVRDVVTWSATEGLTSREGTVRPGTAEPAKALEAVLTIQEPTAFLFRDLHPFLGDGHRPADTAVVRRLREVGAALKTGALPSVVILVSPILRIPPELEKEVTIVDFPLPDESEIHGVLRRMEETNSAAGGRVRVLLDDLGRERLVKAALGLTVNEAENAFARAMVNDGVLDADDVEVVLEEKRQTIRKSGMLEFVNVDVSLEDVGGLQNLKRWLAKREGSWLDEAAQYGLPAPRGVLITGVPGCGKSLTAKAIAAAWELPLLRLDIGRVFAGLVGSSEQNMRTAIRTAEAIAPCVLWIDEIEKGFSGVSGAGGDGGTSSRVFGSFLTWMQEKSKAVFVIATANNINSLPPEFLRKGRFDEIFFVDLPTLPERRQIWDLHLNKRLSDVSGRSLLDQTSVLDQLAASSEGYSGAEIEQAVVAGLFDAFAERRTITADDLARAVANMVPLSVTQAEQIAAIRSWAELRAVAATAATDRSGYVAPTPAAPPPPEPTDSSAGDSIRGGRVVDF